MPWFVLAALLATALALCAGFVALHRLLCQVAIWCQQGRFSGWGAKVLLSVRTCRVGDAAWPVCRAFYVGLLSRPGVSVDSYLDELGEQERYHAKRLTKRLVSVTAVYEDLALVVYSLLAASSVSESSLLALELCQGRLRELGPAYRRLLQCRKRFARFRAFHIARTALVKAHADVQAALHSVYASMWYRRFLDGHIRRLTAAATCLWVRDGAGVVRPVYVDPDARIQAVADRIAV
jgi:hypothetical protein